MAPNNEAKPPAMSPTSLSSPLEFRTRRDSLSSVAASSHTDKEQLAMALDKIHTSASQSDALTTFNDFAPPPDSAPVQESKSNASDVVQQGLSGLYTRLKEAVGVVGKGLAQEADDFDNQDAASKRSTSTNNTTSKAVGSPAPRTDTATTNSTFNSQTSSDIPTSATTASRTGTSDFESQVPASSKTSISNMTASKSSAGSQHLPKIAKAAAPTVANPAVVPVTVNAYKELEAARGITTRTEEPASRTSSRKSISKPGDGVPVVDIPSNGAPPANLTERRRSRRDVDGNSDTIASPTKSNGNARNSSSGSRTAAGDSLRTPAVIDRISHSRSRSNVRSRSSSMEAGAAAPSPISTSAHNSVYHSSFSLNERPEQLKSGVMRIPGTTTDEGAPEMVNARLEMMRKQVVSKDFWMADETCKECFACGTPFTAFRRKHHCRTCGCIFDSKCTSTISGQKFGVPGSIRVCKTCLDIINRRYDDGSDDSADESYLPAIFRPNQSKAPAYLPRPAADDNTSIAERNDDANDERSNATPMMAIPTRRIGDGNRSSAVLEIDAPQLSRPSSSRSLRALAAGRPQSSGHKTHISKQNFLTRFKATTDDRAPFRSSVNEELGRKSKLPAFHDDNIIDPELAPYMSDESSNDEQMSIFATMTSNDLQPSSLDPEKSNFGPYLTTGRKHRFRQGNKSVSGLSFTSRGLGEGSGPPNLPLHARPGRRRNMSTASASAHHLRSPRPKSGVFAGPSASTETLSLYENPSVADGPGLSRSESVREAKVPEAKLSPASLNHVRKLFKQLLEGAEIPNPPAWEKALIPILLRCAQSIAPGVHGNMDIRRAVKLKKIPGGKPSDTSYVSGVVFTKNLALKSMPRRIYSPRIVVVSFPIEYQRQQQQHFMSLQPVIEQEKEFLRVVVNRIISLRPQLLLAEKSVAGVALQYLSEANIAVAYNVKPTVIEAVARSAQTEIISSLDMLALPVVVGGSENFEARTFVNNSVKGNKKTYLYISGCDEELGCTIALRGASTEVLARLKTIAEFMVYVVYNLRLESSLMQDEHVEMSNTGEESVPPSQLTDDSLRSSIVVDPNNPTVVITSQSSESEKVTQSSDAGSLSGAADAPTEALPVGVLEQSRKLISLHESHAHSVHDASVPEDVPMPTYYSDMVAKYQTKILSASPSVKFHQPYLLMKAREQERRLVYLKRLRDQDIIEEQVEGEKTKPQKFQLIKPEMVHEIGQKAPRQIMEVLHAVHDAEYDKALYNYQTQTRQWESYIQGSLDLFDPYSHQNIVVLHSVVCTDTSIPCFDPGLIAIGFYEDNPDPHGGLDRDLPLGQYIIDLCYGADELCHSNGCDRPMYSHHRTYVHDEARLTFFVEKDSPHPSGVEKKKADDIVMWNYCKLCKKDIGVTVMSSNTWMYSFGKYLELSFCSKGLRLIADPDTGEAACPHHDPKEHIRYFNFRGDTLRIHYDPIDLLEIIVPRARITWKVDHDLKLKNDTFKKAESRWNRFMNSARSRLKGIRTDDGSILPEKAEDCKAEVARLLKKADEDQTMIVKKLQDVYMNSKYYEIVPFNPIIRHMLEIVSEWDTAFTSFEADFLSDKDVHQLTLLQLKKMFTDNESKDSLPTTEGSTSTTTDTDEKSTPPTTQSSASTEAGDKLSSSVDTDDATPVPTPAEQPGQIVTEEAVTQTAQELERVEPLDLATPQTPVMPKLSVETGEAAGEGKKAALLPDAAISTSAQQTEPGSPDTLPARPSLVTQLTLTEKVEQLRREHRMSADVSPTGPSGSTANEPPRAVPERASSRKAGLTVSPPMVRALSQPVGALPRTQSGIGKLVKEPPKIPEPGNGHELSRVPTDSSIKTEKKFSDKFGLGALKHHRKSGQSSIPRYVQGGKRKESKVSALARHFDQLTREFEKERMKDRKQRAAKMHHSRAFLPRTSTKATVEVYENVDQAVQEPGPSDDDHLLDRDQQESGPSGEASQQAGSISETSPTKVGEDQDLVSPTDATSHAAEETATEATETDNDTHRESQANSDDEGGASDTEQSLLEDILPEVEAIADSLEPNEDLPKHQKTSLMKMLTNFWAERSASGWTPLDYPLNATDHIFIDSDIIVREDEPSSLISFALSSKDYMDKLADIRRQWKVSAHRDAEAGGGEGGDDMSLRSETDSNASKFIDQEELEKSLLRVTGTHLKYQFVEGSAKMLCKIFYAEQFDALRRKCGVADRIVESLSRCLKWDSKGGKTKSVFLKTLDDRLVMKSLSPIETSAFLRFAPAYFSIMAEALFHELPSVIAKMLGFFQVIIKNPLTNTEIKLDLLVMENLFYDRSPTRIFDLKGSMRNRKIQSTGEQNEVLLDENMVDYIYESPLFAREHSKRLLRASVWNDTLFLARQNVMDYSLMIAIDEARKELVVGIIDCIRTYTWDKRLESWIKDRGFAGGGRNKPTVTSPKEYKSRFREAMARYILQAPNSWHHFGSVPTPTALTGTGAGAGALRTRFEGDD